MRAASGVSGRGLFSQVVRLYDKNVKTKHLTPIASYQAADIAMRAEVPARRRPCR